MSLDEYLKRFYDPIPPTIEAIPVEWIEKYMRSAYRYGYFEEYTIISQLLEDWNERRKENESV